MRGQGSERAANVATAFNHAGQASKHHTGQAQHRRTLSSYTRARSAPKKSMDWPGKASTRVSTSARLTLSCCGQEC